MACQPKRNRGTRNFTRVDHTERGDETAETLGPIDPLEAKGVGYDDRESAPSLSC